MMKNILLLFSFLFALNISAQVKYVTIECVCEQQTEQIGKSDFETKNFQGFKVYSYPDSVHLQSVVAENYSDVEFTSTKVIISGKSYNKIDIINYVGDETFADCLKSGGASSGTVVDGGCFNCPPGETGPAGEDGPVGPQGEDGPPGADGAMGLPGADGADGDKGDTGDTGPQGDPGADGEDGISVTDYSYNAEQDSMIITLSDGTELPLEVLAAGGAFECSNVADCIDVDKLQNVQGLDSIIIRINGVVIETFNDTNLPSTSIEPYLDENLDTIFAKGTFVHNDGTTDCIKLCDCPYTIQVDDQVGDLLTSCGWHTVDLSLGDQPCLNTFGDTLLTIYSIESSNVVASIDPLTGIATYSLDLNEDGECADFTDDAEIIYTASCADGTSSTGTYTAPVDVPCNSCVSFFTSDNNTKRNLNYLTQTSGLAPNVGGIDGHSSPAHIQHIFFNHQVPNGSGTPERDVHWKVMEVGLDCTPIVCDIEATAPLFINDGTANGGVPAATNKWIQWGDYVELVIQNEYNISISFTTAQPFYDIPNDGENRIDGYFNYTSSCDDCGIEYIKIGRYNPDGTPLLVDDGNGNLTQPYLIQTWVRSDLNVVCDVIPSQNVECN